MTPNTATALAALGMTARAPLTDAPAQRQNTLSTSEVVASVVGQSAGGIDAPAPKGDQPGYGLAHGWETAVNAVVAEIQGGRS